MNNKLLLILFIPKNSFTSNHKIQIILESLNYKVMKLLSNFKESPIFNLLLILVIPWVILAVIFGFFDLEISKIIVDSNSLWGKIGRDYAHIPGYSLVIVAITILVGCNFDDIQTQKKVGYLIIITFIIILFSHLISKNYSEALLVFSVILALMVFSFFTYTKNWKDYMKFAIIVILMVLILTAFVEITKVLSGRVRYNDLNSNYSNYTPWFLPPGPDPKNRSFPSGHAAQGWYLLPLLLIVKDRKYNNGIKIFITTLVFGWGFFIAISRVIIGDHYASDVLFSTGAAMLIFILLYNWIYLDNKKGNYDEEKR